MLQKILLVLFVFARFRIEQVTAQDNVKLQTVLLDSTLTKNANAIVGLQNIIIEINSVTSVVVKTKRTNTVLCKYGNIYFNSYEGYSSSRKIRKLEMVMCNAFGKEIKSKKEKFEDEIENSSIAFIQRWKPISVFC